MSNDEIIKVLKEERVKVCEQKASLEEQSKATLTRIKQIDESILALGGTVDQRRESPPIATIIEAAARSLPAGTVFDHADLKAKATAIYPTLVEKIKTGVYSATAALLKKKVFIRESANPGTGSKGGFKLAP